MPAKRLSMRKIKEVLRLSWVQGLSKRQTARSCGISRPAVDEYLRRAEQAGLSWPLPEELDDGALERLLFPLATALPAEERAVPDWAAVNRELKRKG
nr:transposase [Gammaproteobacteria bacterium]